MLSIHYWIAILLIDFVDHVFADAKAKSAASAASAAAPSVPASSSSSSSSSSDDEQNSPTELAARDFDRALREADECDAELQTADKPLAAAAASTSASTAASDAAGAPAPAEVALTRLRQQIRQRANDVILRTRHEEARRELALAYHRTEMKPKT